MLSSNHCWADGLQAVTVNYYVDESGTPTVFARRRRVIVGQDGCSKYFMLGKVEISDPSSLSSGLETLRGQLLADPYFRKVPSLQLQSRKTALIFHAKDGVPEVRYEVFKFLRQQDIRFYAVVKDKMQLASEVLERNREDPSYRYAGNDLYDRLVADLFSKRFYVADRFDICFAIRGNKPRTDALKAALTKAKLKYERSFGYESVHSVRVMPSTPLEEKCLQVVDYYLWALQRLYEQRDDKFIETIWPQTSLIHDLDDARGKRGVYYKKDHPLNLDEFCKRKSRRR